jgi:hypothetical protein
MDETSLRAMFERAVAERPPTPRLIPDSVRAGTRLRKRRKIVAAAGSAVAVAVIAAVVPVAAGAFGGAAPRPAATVDFAGSGTAYIWTGTNTVTPVRLRTDKVLTPLRVPGVIQDIDATPDGSAVVVFSNTEPNTNSGLFSYVTSIDSATGKAGRTIKLTGNGLVQTIAGVQLAPNGKLAYATETGTWPANGKYGSSALVAINLVTGAERVLADNGGYGWAMTSGGRTAYEAGFSQEVNAFDLGTSTLLRPIKLQAPGTVWSVAFAPRGGTIYAASVPRIPPTRSGRSTTSVTPISTATNKAGKPIQVQNAGFLAEIAVAPDGETGYVSGGQYLSPVILATGRALKPIKLPSAFAEYLSTFQISPDSKFGEWYQARSTSVQLINLASGRLLTPVTLPGSYRQSAAGAFPGGSTVYVPASIYRVGLPSLGALFPVQLANQHVGKPILFSGVPNGVVLVP